MKVLIVSWHFPPNNAIAAVRAGKLARFLEGRGHEVRVVTTARQAEDRSLPLEIEESRVVRVPFLDVNHVLDPRQWRGSQRPGPMPAMTAGGLAHGGAPPGPAALGPRLRAGLGQLYRSLAFFPDRQVGWGRYLVPALRSELRDHRPDVVLVSGPPFSSFLWTSHAAKRFGIPWIAEFRDRWSDDSYTEIPGWRRPIDRWLEQRVLATAAGIVTVSQPWAQAYATKYRVPVRTVMNGYDPKDFAGAEDRPQPELPLRIVHVGTIYRHRRDPTALLDAVAGRFGPQEVRLVFCGQYPNWVRDLASRRNMLAQVEFLPPVPYQEALRLQSSADVLLLLQWNAPGETGNVPGKLFEYFATGRPILGLGPEAGIPAQLIRERAAGVFSNDPQRLAAQIADWVEEKRRTGQIAPLAPAARAGLTRDEQFAVLLDFIEGIGRQMMQQSPTVSPRGRSTFGGWKSKRAPQ
jgi:glycosyltransferase involved in cell wall biosynthesis